MWPEAGRQGDATSEGGREGGELVQRATGNVGRNNAGKRKKEGASNRFCDRFRAQRAFGSTLQLQLAKCIDEEAKSSYFINLATSFTTPLKIGFFLLTP